MIVIRNVGNIIYDITQHYDRQVSVKSLRELEKLYIKLEKSILDTNFLNHCKKFGVILKFLYLNLPYTNNNDAKAFQKITSKCTTDKKQRKKKHQKRSE